MYVIEFNYLENLGGGGGGGGGGGEAAEFYSVGDSVEVQWTDNKWYAATVLKAEPPISIKWEDGGRRMSNITLNKIR